jgi:hypothetical protein
MYTNEQPQVKYCDESPVRSCSEIEQEIINLNAVIEEQFHLVDEIKERLSDILKPPMPETSNGAGISDSPSSNIGMTIREKSYQLKNINDQIENIIKRLAI